MTIVNVVNVAKEGSCLAFHLEKHCNVDQPGCFLCSAVAVVTAAIYQQKRFPSRSVFSADAYLQRGQGIIVWCKADIRRVALKVGIASFTEHEIHSVRARCIGHVAIAR